MQPSIGRIVNYTLTEGDVALIDSRIPQSHEGHTARNHVHPGEVYPAIVVRVFPGGTQVNGVCNLQVFLDGNDTYWATSRTEGTTPGTWAWPPRA